MKDKTKKIIAGIGLGVVLGTSGILMAGCSMSDDQKNALNTVVDKADEIITLVEDNMDYTNLKLSKEDASEIIGLVRSDFLLNNYSEIKASLNMEMYSGVFDKKIYSSKNNDLYYRQSNNTKTKAVLNNNVVQSITTSNFTDNKHYEYTITQDGNLRNELTYNANMWINGEFDLFNQDYVAFLGDVTSDKIKNIEIIEGGYRFELDTLVSSGDTSIAEGNERVVVKLNMIIELINSKIVKATFKGLQFTVACSELDNDGENIILDENGIPNGYLSVNTNAQITGMMLTVDYEYENIDFTAIDNKIAEIDKNY